MVGSSPFSPTSFRLFTFRFANKFNIELNDTVSGGSVLWSVQVSIALPSFS